MTEQETQKREDYLRKVRALWDRALHPETPKPEAEACEKKAAALMAKYEISQLEVMAKGSDVDLLAECSEQSINAYGESRTPSGKLNAQGMWQTSLAGKIARVFDCQLVLGRKEYNTIEEYDQTRTSLTFSFLGFTSDVITTLYFFEYIRRWIAIQANQAVPGNKKSPKILNMRISRCQGMVDEVSHRLNRMYKEKKDILNAEGCTALVVRKDDLVDQFMKQKYSNLSPAKYSKTGIDPAQYNAGREDGKKIPIHKQMGGGSDGAPMLTN